MNRIQQRADHVLIEQDSGVDYANEHIHMEYLTDAGVVFTTATVLFTARVVFEQTLLTWARGAQSLESSAPQFGMDSLGVLCVILGMLMHLLDYLLAHGTDVNTQARYGESPLGAAAAAGQMQAARHSIARGARLENSTYTTSETPLLEAAQMNRTDMVEFLLDRGANPAAKDVMDYTALDWAQKNANTKMANLIRARLEKDPASMWARPISMVSSGTDQSRFAGTT